MIRPWAGSSHAPGLASLGFIAIVAATAWPRHQVLAIYLVSYWHYYAYWLAFRHGRIALATFKPHAMLLKTMSLVALGTAYLSVPIAPVSLAVVAAGFLLNAVAARALGSDRTYYGHEVAGLPRQRINSFPYQLISHPMLIGNIAAFGGTLLNTEFRREWWPLAAIHVGLNLALMLMELRVTPMRGGEIAADERPGTATLLAWTACLAVGAGLGAAPFYWSGHGIRGASFGAAAVAHLLVMRLCYIGPAGPSLRSHTPRKERS